MENWEEQAWGDLAEYAVPEAVPEMLNLRLDSQASVSVVERLVSSFLSGNLALLMLSGASFLLCTGAWDPRVLLACAFLAPLINWGLVAFSRQHDGLSSGRLLLLSMPVLFLCSVVSLGPIVGLHSLEGKPVHIEYLSWAFQGILENALRPAILGYILFCGILALLVGVAKRAYPWIDLQASSSGSIKRRLGLFALVGIVFLSLGFWYLWPSSAETDWIADQAQALADRPFGALPKDGVERMWRERDQDVQDRIAAVSGMKTSSSREHRRQALAGLPLELDYQNEKPRSLAEVRAAISYLASIEDGDLPAEHSQIKRLALSLEARPYQGGDVLDGVVEHFVLPALCESEGSHQQLEQLRQNTAALRSQFQSPETTLDQLAYWVIWFHPDTLSRTDDHMGYTSEAHEVVGGKAFRSWLYRGNPRPRDMMVLGQQVPWSPTRLALRFNQVRLTREWLAARESLFEGTGSHRSAFIRSKILDEPGVRPMFWREIVASSGVERLRHNLETAELILKLRLYRVKSNEYPERLDALLREIDFAEAPDKRYQWDPTTADLLDQRTEVRCKLLKDERGSVRGPVFKG